jgi:hypothetical protein
VGVEGSVFATTAEAYAPVRRISGLCTRLRTWAGTRGDARAYTGLGEMRVGHGPTLLLGWSFVSVMFWNR